MATTQQWQTSRGVAIRHAVGCKSFATSRFCKRRTIADIFDAGTHTLSSENLPVLSTLIGIPFGGRSPFTAEVYFFNKAVAMDNKFGLIPFNMIEPKFRVPIPVTSRGSFAIQVADVRTFITQIIGTVPDFEAKTITQYFRGVITEQIKTAIMRIAQEQSLSPLELEAIVLEVSGAVRCIISSTLADYGLHLKLFNIEGISIIDENPRVKKVWDDYQHLMKEDMEERMRLKRRAEHLDIYKVERSFDTTEKVAENIGGGDGGAGGILGTMVGLGMVNPLAQTMGNMVSNVMPNPNMQQPVQMNKDEIIKLLEKLGELKTAGILTEEEFAEKKKELLSKI